VGGFELNFFIGFFSIFSRIKSVFVKSVFVKSVFVKSVFVKSVFTNSIDSNLFPTEYSSKLLSGFGTKLIL